MGELLLRHGADRNAVNFTASASPLHLAAKHGHLSMVELLMLYNAVTDNRDGNLRTPLHRYSGLGFIFSVIAEMKKKKRKTSFDRSDAYVNVWKHVQPLY